jgi:copper transport protein
VVARQIAIALALVAALLLPLACATDVDAHASLLTAVPADGAVMPDPPAALTLTFNEAVSPLVVRLIGPDGQSIAPLRVAAENATITVAAPQRLQRGTHVLSWRVISADGHPVGGSLIFSIGAPSGPPASAAQETSDRSVRAALWAVKLVIYLGLFAGVGGAFFRAWIADPGSPAAQAWIGALLAAGLVAAPVSVGLQGLDALDLPLAGLTRAQAWDTGAATTYGRTAIAAALAMLAGLVSLSAKPLGFARGFALVGLLGVGTALSLSGHASTAEPQLVSRSAVFLHGVCVAFWIGALLPLYLVVRDANAPALPGGGAALERFSRAIPLAVGLLAASGLWLAFIQLGRVDALWTTGYGQVLACKLAAVVVLLGLAAANRYLLVPRLERGGAGAARPLATSIAFEVIVAIVILALVALWRFTPPPRAVASAAPISIHLHGEKAMAQIEIERPKGEGGRASLMVLDSEFQPLAVKEVTLVLESPAAGIEPMRRNATRRQEAGARSESGNWRIDDLRIPVAGRWNLRIELLVSDFDKVMIEDTVTLPRVP